MDNPNQKMMVLCGDSTILGNLHVGVGQTYHYHMTGGRTIHEPSISRYHWVCVEIG